MQYGALFGLSLAAVLLVISANSPLPSYYAYERMCQAKFNVTSHELLAMLSTTNFTNLENRFKCHVHCVMELLHYFDAAGHINVLRIMHREGYENALFDLVEQCRATHADLEEPCAVGFHTLDCIRQIKNIKNVFDIPPSYLETLDDDEK